MWGKFKKGFDKFWFFLWKDDSFKGWIFSLIFLFLFMKFIFMPGLAFVTGTSLPLAIVESCSMYHNGNLLSSFNNWWEDHDNKYINLDISEEQFREFSFKKGFNKGDILFMIKANPEKLKIGDVIIFDPKGQYPNPLIHRIIEIEIKDGKYYYSTIGDNNAGQLAVEKEISEDQLIAKAVVRIVPYAGWVKLVFFEPFRNPSERGLCKS